MRNKIQAPGKQVLHKQVPKAQALQKEKDPRLVAVGGFGQATSIITIIANFVYFVKRPALRVFHAVFLAKLAGDGFDFFQTRTRLFLGQTPSL